MTPDSQRRLARCAGPSERVEYHITRPTARLNTACGQFHGEDRKVRALEWLRVDSPDIARIAYASERQHPLRVTQRMCAVHCVRVAGEPISVTFSRRLLGRLGDSNCIKIVAGAFGEQIDELAGHGRPIFYA